MKLKNKKTGEIVDYNPTLERWNGPIKEIKHYGSLAELNEEWEDYEEPKVGYVIDPMEEDCVSADDSGYEESDVKRAKELGIWFETEEEAEKAVERLRAWKRLKDKGFRFKWWARTTDSFGDTIEITATSPTMTCSEELDTLFGGEE